MDSLSSAPRWFLALALTTAAGLAAWQEIKWRASVETHMAESSQGYQRIAAAEARIAALEQHARWCRIQHGETR